MTALTGGNISDDSLAISTAILAAPYAVLQPDSLDDSGSFIAVSAGSEVGDAIDRAMALEEAASALRPFARGWNAASSCFRYSTIDDIGVSGGLFVGVADGEDIFRK